MWSTAWSRVVRFYHCDYEVGILELLFRIFLTAGVAVVSVMIPLSCAPPPPPLRYVVDDVEIGQAQEVMPVDVRKSVDIYGDSRARFFGEGAALVPGWYPVTNLAREGCAFLGQDRFFVDYNYGVYERTISDQLNGTSLACDTRLYVGTRPYVDLAIVYAGTLLTVNNGVSEDSLHSPTEPEHYSYLLANITQTLSRIDAGRVVVLDTPLSTEGYYWNDLSRIGAVDNALREATAAVGGTFLTGFADWVEAQPSSCHPDGSHFTVDCALQAGLWIDAQLKGQL